MQPSLHQCQQSRATRLITAKILLNQVLKVSSGTCQQFVADAVKISNILDFRILKVV